MKKIKYYSVIFFTILIISCSYPRILFPESTSSIEQDVKSETSTSTIPNTISNLGTFCQNPILPTIRDFNIYQYPNFSEPLPRIEYTDPVFGTCMVRVTDRSKDLSPEDSSAGLKNEYSRVQAFNADESMIMVRGIDATWYLYDAVSLLPLHQVSISVDPRWDASNPNKFYYSDGTSLYSFDVKTDQSTLLRDFAQEFPGQDLAAVWTRYEGSPSMDSTYYGLMAQNKDWMTMGFIIYDMKNNKIVAKLQLPRAFEIDSVTISLLGKYFLGFFDNFCETGQLGTESNPCGLMVYDQNLQNGRGLLRLVGHADTALDAEGREVLVYQDIDRDKIAYVDLASGNITDLFDIDFSHTAIGLHFSGQAIKTPDWVVVSTHGDSNTSYTWMDNQVFAIELKPGPRIARLAHTHSLVDSTQEHDYWAEPQATVNHDLTRILFTSNWNRSGTGEVDMYLIQLPKGWTDNLH